MVLRGLGRVERRVRRGRQPAGGATHGRARGDDSALSGEDHAKRIIGRAPEELSLPERLQLAGKWMALELYSPTRLMEVAGSVEIELKQRRIRAVGDSALDCIRQLEQAGLRPSDYEFTLTGPPY